MALIPNDLSLTDEEIQNMLDEFMKVNFEDGDEDEDGWCCSKGASNCSSGCSSGCDSKICPKCSHKMGKTTSVSFNGDKFDVYKCSNTKCGHCI